MSNRYRVLIGVLLAATLTAAVGFMAYNAGVAHGLAESGRSVYVWPRPWGFGFGSFPFFFILLWFFLLRGLFWGGRRGWGRWDDRGVPRRFEEWHRRAHEQDGTLRPAPGNQA